jgi:hypothetical protein
MRAMQYKYQLYAGSNNKLILSYAVYSISLTSKHTYKHVTKCCIMLPRRTGEGLITNPYAVRWEHSTDNNIERIYNE